MTNIFNMAEVVDIGIEKEKKRRDFYGAVAEKMAEGDLKELFKKLHDWEEEHVKKFSEIRREVDERESFESYPGEEGDYMEALVSDQLYADLSPEETAASIKEPLDAIQLGIGFEKDAILFFRGLGNFLRSPRKEVLRQLVREEQEHLVYLIRLREKYRD